MPKAKSEKQQIGLRLDPDLAEWLEKRAQAEDRPLAYVARRIIAAARDAEERTTKRRKS
jgi:predicted transcriptional regulator